MNSKHLRISGATLVEVLIAASIVAILAAGAVHILSGLKSSSELAKLRNDVTSINQAVAVYRAFGGSLDSARTPQEVLAHLRTRADAVSSEQNAGLSGQMLDSGIAAVMQSPAEAGRPGPRAIWNVEDVRFEIVHAGGRGVKCFRIDEALASLPPVEESRTTGMKLATHGEWIWDYSDRAADVTPGLTEVEKAGVGLSEIPQKGSSGLKAPEFSVRSGTFPATHYNLSLLLTDPNPAGVSRIVYTVNSGGWTVYNGQAIPVGPESTISAYAESIDSKWGNSDIVKERFKVTPVELHPPGIEMSGRRFDSNENQVITVALTNPNDSEVSMLEVRVSGGRWVPYSEPFTLHTDDNPIGAIIEGRVVPLKLYYLESDIAITSIDRPAGAASISSTAP